MPGLGEAVRERRLELGLSQRALAQQAGVALLTLRRIESGQPVRALSVQHLDEALGWPRGRTRELLGDRHDTSPGNEQSVGVRRDHQQEQSLLLLVTRRERQTATDDELVGALRLLVDEQARRLRS